MDATQKSQVLIEALPYFKEFDEKIIVVKLGGNAMNESSLFSDTLQDIVFMEQVGLRPVLVHGGGPYISKRLKEKGVQTEFVDGLRVTSQECLDTVEEVFREINLSICREIDQLGGHSSSIMGFDDLFWAEKKKTKEKKKVDLGFVGELHQVKSTKIKKLTEAGIVPVISPMATSLSGQVYNVNADTAASSLAESLKSEKLVFMSNIEGIMRKPGDVKTLFTTLHPSQVEELIDSGVITGGMLPKVEASLEALRIGVNKVHIIDGRRHHSLLLEIFTPQGVGTQFVKEEKSKS